MFIRTDKIKDAFFQREWFIADGTIPGKLNGTQQLDGFTYLTSCDNSVDALEILRGLVLEDISKLNKFNVELSKLIEKEKNKENGT